MDFDEPVCADDRLGSLAIDAVRRYERCYDDQPVLVHQPGDFGRAPHVFMTIALRKTEVAVQSVPQVVSIEHRARLLVASKKVLMS